MPGAQPSTTALRVALGSPGPRHEATVQLRVPSSGKMPYGASQLQSLSSVGKTKGRDQSCTHLCGAEGCCSSSPFSMQNEAGAGFSPCSEHAGTAPHSKLVPDVASAVR